MKVSNLFTGIPGSLTRELIEPLIETGALTLERIVSLGHATPAGEWYDQERNEWVILLSGRAALQFENEPEPVVLQPGDYLLIPAHRKHRVEWTVPGENTVWLAMHFHHE